MEAKQTCPIENQEQYIQELKDKFINSKCEKEQQEIQFELALFDEEVPNIPFSDDEPEETTNTKLVDAILNFSEKAS